MPSKISSFKKEIWKQGFRSSGWIAIAYYMALFFILPLNILMEKSRQDAQNITHPEGFADNLIQFNLEFQVVLYVIMPVLAAISSCRYMHMKGSADFYHSLPVRRSQLFIHQFSLGYMLIIIPVLLIGFSLFMIYGIVDVDFIYQHEDILDWLVVAWTVNTIIYTCSFLIGILTGMSIVQGLLSFIFLFFPAGIVMLTTYNIEQLLWGFESTYFWGEELASVSPIIWLMDNFSQEINVTNPPFLYYWALSIATVLLAYWLYRIRDVEAANQPIAFTVLKPFFKFGVTFCFMLLGGAYFGTVQGNVLSWLFFGYVFGAFLGYVLSEMLIQKTWRIFHQWKGFLLYIGISFVVMFSLVFDLFGYETRVPAQENVEEVFFSDGMLHQQMDKNEANIKNPVLLKHIIELHKYIISQEENRNHQQRVYGPDATDITITYFLENGSEIHRSYYVPDRKAIQQYLKPIAEAESYKRSIVSWLYDEKKQFDMMQVYGMNGSREMADTEVISKTREALKRDYLNTSYSEIQFAHHMHVNIIEFTDSDRFYSLPLLSSYDHTMAVLNEENFTELLEVEEDEVKIVAIINSADRSEMFPELPYLDTVDTDEWLIIDEKEQIQKIIDLKEKENMDGTWEVGLYGPVRERFITGFRLNEQDVPRFVKEKLE